MTWADSHRSALCWVAVTWRSFVFKVLLRLTPISFFFFFLLFTIKSNGLSKHINLSHGAVAPLNPGADFPNWCAATVTVTTGSDGKTSSRLLYYLYFPPLSLTQQVLQKWWEHCFPLCVTLASVTHPSPHNAFPPCCWTRLTCGNRDTRLKCSLPLKAL